MRIKDAEEMKMRYYDGEDRLAIKGVGYEQVQGLLKAKLAGADEKK